jgi:hypothetical protein
MLWWVLWKVPLTEMHQGTTRGGVGALHVNKSPPVISVMSQLNPIHTFKTYFFKIDLALSLHCSRSSKVVFSHQIFWTKFCVSHPSDASCMPRPSHLYRILSPNNIWWRVKVMKLIGMQFSPVLCYFLVGTNILLSTWNTFVGVHTFTWDVFALTLSNR